mmetsp:Transcript_25060/g.87392  ORF Transcript_25060/g.87392 Transcript_25060/m.87392 type:complete len:361 (-) Transcript_25060:212-1294(-)
MADTFLLDRTLLRAATFFRAALAPLIAASSLSSVSQQRSCMASNALSDALCSGSIMSIRSLTTSSVSSSPSLPPFDITSSRSCTASSASTTASANTSYALVASSFGLRAASLMAPSASIDADACFVYALATSMASAVRLATVAVTSSAALGSARAARTYASARCGCMPPLPIACFASSTLATTSAHRSSARCAATLYSSFCSFSRPPPDTSAPNSLIHSCRAVDFRSTVLARLSRTSASLMIFSKRDVMFRPALFTSSRASATAVRNMSTTSNVATPPPSTAFDMASSAASATSTTSSASRSDCVAASLGLPAASLRSLRILMLRCASSRILAPRSPMAAVAALTALPTLGSSPRKIFSA